MPETFRLFYEEIDCRFILTTVVQLQIYLAFNSNVYFYQLTIEF